MKWMDNSSINCMDCRMSWSRICQSVAHSPNRFVSLSSCNRIRCWTPRCGTFNQFIDWRWHTLIGRHPEHFLAFKLCREIQQQPTLTPFDIIPRRLTHEQSQKFWTNLYPQSLYTLLFWFIQIVFSTFILRSIIISIF